MIIFVFWILVAVDLGWGNWMLDFMVVLEIWGEVLVFLVVNLIRSLGSRKYMMFDFVNKVC